MHCKISNSGEKERPDYKPKYNDNGSYELVQCGVIHSYEDVQAWACTCDMSQIMDRYIRTGDTALLNRRAGFYGDVTELPKNYAQLHNLLNNADDIFNALPAELKEKFGHNPAVFYADTEKANGILSDFINKNITVVDTSVVTPDVPDVTVVEGGVVNE